MRHLLMPRREFLLAAGITVGTVVTNPFLFSHPQTTDLEKFAHLRANLLEMVNEERAVEKVQPLAMDPLATPSRDAARNRDGDALVCQSLGPRRAETLSPLFIRRRH